MKRMNILRVEFQQGFRKVGSNLLSAAAVSHEYLLRRRNSTGSSLSAETKIENVTGPVFRCTVVAAIIVAGQTVCSVHDGNTRLARRSDEELEVRVSLARIAPSLLDLGRGVDFPPQARDRADRLFVFCACPRHSRWLSGKPALLPPRRSGFNPRPGHSEFSHAGESCRTIPLVGGFFSGFSRFARPLFPALLHSNPFTLIGSQDLDVESRPNLFHHSPTPNNTIQSRCQQEVRVLYGLHWHALQVRHRLYAQGSKLACSVLVVLRVPMGLSAATLQHRGMQKGQPYVIFITIFLNQIKVQPTPLPHPLQLPKGRRFTPGFSYVGLAPDDAVDRRVFSVIFRFLRPCIPALLRTRLASPTSALKTSLLRAAENLCTPLRPNDLSEWRATVAERLACSPPTKAIRVQFPDGSLRIFACGDRAVRCCWSAGFLGDLPFPSLFHSGAAPFSPQSRDLPLSRP
ncbi:hypothetical protein PR048_031491 [Dryococelus australis]|uniref:Uncharacterized protein n=1 Tax=Dryococelus australis TaxID=614101 RepID=A0ABQ9G8E7_9NEOP|nr:hypothetical protein PR048_031491 [Dryococelus australis]